MSSTRRLRTRTRIWAQSRPVTCLSRKKSQMAAACCPVRVSYQQQKQVLAVLHEVKTSDVRCEHAGPLAERTLKFMSAPLVR